MKHHLGRATRGRFGRAPIVGLLAVALVGLAAGPAVAQTALKKKKPLSMTNVVIETGPNAVNGAVFIANTEGFFSKFGLNASLLNINTGASQDIASLVGGAAQFSVSGSSTEVAAAQAGGPLRAVLIPGVGGPQQIELTQAFVAKHPVPAAGNTPKQALAQIMALKGTHAVIANSSITSNSYAWMSAVFRKYGLTWGVGCSSCDINTTFTGTVPNEVTAYAANKVDGIANVPPTTDTSPVGVIVQYGKVAPLNETLANFMVTTPSMILSHPDTVQAVVNAMVYTMAVWRDYGKKHEAQAERDIEQVIVANGMTQDQAVLATQIQIPYLKNPYPTKLTFNTTINTYNISTNPPYTLAYKNFVVPRFALAAEKLLHVALPKGI